MRRSATITVIGRDKTGVIARVTSFLFEQQANIEALEEQVTRGQFSMTVQASWPRAQFNPASVRAGLEQLARALDMEIKFRLTEPDRRQRMAVFVTRETHCLEGILKANRARQLNRAEPVVVISNRRELGLLARRAGLPFVHIPWNKRAGAERKALRALDAHQIDFIVLARFMKILSPNFV